jgi:hypothetical protein
MTLPIATGVTVDGKNAYVAGFAVLLSDTGTDEMKRKDIPAT